MPSSPSVSESLLVNEELIESYRQDGFVKVESIISRVDAMAWGEAAELAAGRMKKMEYAGNTFDQCVNVWQQDETMKRLTLHPNIASAAEDLAGVPLRLWHDQTLIKRPKISTATEFHQDQPYWPHAESTHPISCWIALCDVPVERGCMTFLPGYQDRHDLIEQDLQSAASMFEMCPEMVWSPRITVPLRAGDCTFHHGRAPHMATPNLTNDPRIAHVVIFIDVETVFTGHRTHPITDGLDLKSGDRLEGPLFPTAQSIIRD